jgi:hypothetical protein
MSVSLSLLAGAGWQFFDDNGVPLNGGLLYTYAAGTTTPLATYTSSNGVTANSNPIVLDSAGRVPYQVWLTNGSDYKFILQTSTGVTVWTEDDVEANSDLAALAASNGSSLIGFIQAGIGAVARTVQSKLRDTVSVKDFGAVGNGVADDTAAIQAAITYAKTLTAPELIVDYGTYLTSASLTFDLPNHSTISFLGLIRSSVSSSPAIRIGSTSTNTFSLTVTGIKVERTSNDTTTLSSGVQLRNLVASYVDIRKCTGFYDGVLCFADQANGGFSYNEVHLGFIHDNLRNLYLTASGVGYCNENNFYGGSFNHSSGYPAVATTNLFINHFATSVLNNNRFYGPSFEDNSALATAAVINGDNNVIYWPRMENPAIQPTYQIQFTVNARECRVIGHGFTMVNTNISDLGSGNMYETREGSVMRYQTPATAGTAVLKLQSYATGSAKVLSGLDSGGTERSYITGDGDAYLKRALTLEGIPTSGTAGALTLGAGTQTTVGAAGGASALPATPLGYLRVWVGATEVVIPYYNKV